MAIDDNLRSDSVDADDIADAILQLLVIDDSANISSVLSTTSASFVDLTGSDVTVTVTSDDVIYIVAQMNGSHSIIDNSVRFKIVRTSPSADLTGEYYQNMNIAATNGLTQVTTLIARDSAQSGSVTYKVQYRVSAGTGYVSKADIYAIVFRNT